MLALVRRCLNSHIIASVFLIKEVFASMEDGLKIFVCEEKNILKCFQGFLIVLVSIKICGHEYDLKVGLGYMYIFKKKPIFRRLDTDKDLSSVGLRPLPGKK